MGTFKRFTDKQIEAQRVLASDASDCMLFGGSRSGKTFIIVRSIVRRAVKAPGSRHAILRFRFNHVKQSIAMDTFPKVMEMCFPGTPYKIDKTDWYATIEGVESEIWFGGLDDKERTEKILGKEFATIFCNECSQIGWPSIGILRTRLAQKVMQIENGKELGFLKPRMYYDCNPPNKLHWTYSLFIRKINPDDRMPLANPENYVSLQMNPLDNVENQAEGYLESLNNLSAKQRLRFIRGEFADATDGQYFSEDDFEKWRVVEADRLPDFIRVVVPIDPSGADDEDNETNDAIGIMVVALGTDGNAYVLEDCTVKAGPSVWGRVATSAWERHNADCVVGEQNFGGAMVKETIKVANPRVPYRKVVASRGKVQRAEPFSALYEHGKVRHVGRFPELEEELTGFTQKGYIGRGSPNRADALIWGLAELFSGLVKEKVERKVETGYRDYIPGQQGWMA